MYLWGIQNITPVQETFVRLFEALQSAVKKRTVKKRSFSLRFIILYGTMWADIFCRNGEYDF